MCWSSDCSLNAHLFKLHSTTQDAWGFNYLPVTRLMSLSTAASRTSWKRLRIPPVRSKMTCWILNPLVDFLQVQTNKLFGTSGAFYKVQSVEFFMSNFFRIFNREDLVWIAVMDKIFQCKSKRTRGKQSRLFPKEIHLASEAQGSSSVLHYRPASWNCCNRHAISLPSLHVRATMCQIYQKRKAFKGT